MANFVKKTWLAVRITLLLVASAFIYKSEIVQPPEPNLFIDNVPLIEGDSLTGSSVQLSVVVPEPSRNLSATLYVDGVARETIRLTQTEQDFPPVLTEEDGSRIAVKTTRELGPLRIDRWAEFRMTPGTTSVTKPTLRAPPDIWSSRFSVEGTSSPDQRIDIYMSKRGDIADIKPQQFSAHSDSFGRFTSELVAPEIGTYNLWAQASKNGPNYQVLKSLTSVVHFHTKLPAVKVRKLTILLQPGRYQQEYTSTFRRGDPRVQAYLQGDMPVEKLVALVHGHVTYQRGWREVDLRAPRVVSQGDQITITVQAESVTDSDVSAGELRLGRYIRPEINAEIDLLEIRTNGLVLSGFMPTATTGERGSYFWSGRALSDDGLRLQIHSAVERPSIWSITIHDVIGDVWGSLYLAIMQMIPVIWMLLLLRYRFSRYLEGLFQRTIYWHAWVLGGLISFSAVHYLLYRTQLSLSEVIQVMARVLASSAGRDFVQQYQEWIGLAIAYLALLILAASIKSVLRKLPMRRRTSALGADLVSILGYALTFGLLFRAFIAASSYIDGGSSYNLSDLQMELFLGVFASCVLIGSLVGWRYLQSLGALFGLERYVSGRARWLWLGLIIILAYPVVDSFDPTNRSLSSALWFAAYDVERFMRHLATLAPLLVAFLVIALLYATDGINSYLDRKSAAYMLFATFLVGTNELWFLFPISFLLALLVFPSVLMMPREKWLSLFRAREAVIVDRNELIESACNHAEAFVPKQSLLGLGIFGTRAEEKTTREKFSPLIIRLPEEDSSAIVTDLAFSFGVTNDPYMNARQSAKIGFIGAVVFVMIYALPSFVQIESGNEFPYLEAFIRVLSVGGYWLGGAFFLGYFYDIIRGSSGWRKGFWLAAGISLATEPLSIIQASSANDFATIGISILQRLVFFIFVGMVAFDRVIFANAMKDKVDWRLFPLVIGLTRLEAAASVAVAVASVALTTAFTGQLSSVLGQIAAAFIPELSSVPNLTR